ncbi:transmembrane protein, putative [Medicago truncatula]|uniref:Transmembrane protein, putative n=1 Tax=Medicago truncatula TaxID=3880 RepID=G7JE80_MEDTR|nr:transmembrane protein, putative [Medicago truncatula]
MTNIVYVAVSMHYIPVILNLISHAQCHFSRSCLNQEAIYSKLMFDFIALGLKRIRKQLAEAATVLLDLETKV